jgi:hypothetical protein
MESQVLSTPSPLQQLVDRILTSRQITRLDQRKLLSLNSLTKEEQTLIDCVFDRLQRGFLKVVD